MSSRVTLEDIAKRSGVSLATVSLVLREKPGINDETRRRVMDAARDLGYRRRPSADAGIRGLERVGVVVRARAGDAPQTNQFYAPVLAGVEAACRRAQANMLFGAVPVDDDNRPVELPRMLLEDGLDGLVLVGAFVNTTIAGLMQRRALPTVLADGYDVDNGYDSVVSDNFRGAHAAVTSLVRRGHRRIAMVGSTTQSYPSVAERRRGYDQALADAEICPRYYADSRLHRDEAAAAVAELLRRSPEVTALFCSNDDMAIGALQAAQARGRRVPEDLSVVGFDDIEMAALVAPALTTMRVDKVSMGRLAVQLLAGRVEAPEAARVTAVLQPELVERSSVRTLDSAP